MIIIDYGLGNLASINNMLKQIGLQPKVSNNYQEILNSNELILPGVGNFERGMKNLSINSLDDAIVKAAAKGSRILGICLGMHLLFENSEEGTKKGLSLIKGNVKKFKFDNKIHKVPHMGWNYVSFKKTSKLYFPSIKKIKFYFAHSYYGVCQNNENISGLTSYGNDFASIVENENIYGVQFHPEKSHNFGKEFFKNFYKI